MATASVVLSLLWLGGAGSVVAIVCGHWAQHQIAGRWQRGAGRARLGIRLGWLGVIATGVLAVLTVTTPDQLAHQLGQIERLLRRIF